MDLPFNRILLKVGGVMVSHVNDAVKHDAGAGPCFPPSLPDVCLSCLLPSLWYHPRRFFI